MDSGNTWRTVVSPDFALKLGLNLTTDLRPLTLTHIGTAKSDSSMKVLGETRRHIHVQLSTCPTKFKLRPVVVEGLAMPMNIAGPFLKRHNIDQIHSRDSLSLQGKLIPLLKQAASPRATECSLSPLFLEKDVVVPACTTKLITVQAPMITKQRMPSNISGCIVGSLQFMDKWDAHPWINSIALPDKQGSLTVGIMNTLGHDIQIPANTYYGDFHLTCSSQDAARFPWRISTLNLTPAPNKVTAPFKLPDPILPPSASTDSLLGGPTTDENQTARLKFLESTFHLTESDLLQKDFPARQRAALLLLEFWDIFSFKGEFGTTDLISHTIYTEDGPPINQRYRPVNPALEPQLQTQLKEWQDHDVIEESNSPWNFGLVAVRKKNGKIRWCVDFRQLNKISKRDTFPIGNIEDNLARLSSSTVFSGLDASGAFHVVPLSPDSKEKTAFATPFGSYQFKRLPFGLANGPSTYARLVKMVLHGIPTSMALPYLDDVIIHSNSIKSHFDALRQVFLAYRQAGLKLQPPKCQLFRSQIDYLGHTVSSNGIAPLAAYTKLVKDWPLPTTRNETRAFLGKVGYYRRFIKGFAALAKPLTDKLAADGTLDKATFVPTDQFKTAFLTLRSALTTAPILAYPQFSSDQPFILDTDWSQDNAAIGGVLSQKQGGLERVIAYGAKKLCASQVSYPPTKGELYGIIFFVNYWRYYLQHRPFIIRTDHMSLRFIQNMEAPVGMISRWLHLLSAFNFTIQYRPGKSHGNADALSRLSSLKHDKDLPLVDDVDTATSPNFIFALEVLADNSSSTSLPNDSHKFWDPIYLRDKQRADVDMKFLFSFLPLSSADRDKYCTEHFKSMSAPSKLFLGCASSCFIDKQGLIRYKFLPNFHHLPTERHVILLPTCMIPSAIMRAHKQAAHMGPQNTFNRLKMYAFFFNMMATIRRTLLSCGPCQTKTTRLPDQRHSLRSHVPGYPFQVLSLDFVGPFPPSHPHKYLYLFTIKDTFTKWIEAFPMQRATASEVVRVLQTEIFSRFGKCERLHSDRGSQFTGHMLQQLGDVLNIRITQTPAYNPKSNAVERMHRDLKAALMATCVHQPSKWADHIPAILTAFRSAISASTGFSPFQLMFGRNPIEDLDAICPSPTQLRKLCTAPDHFRLMTTYLTQAYQLARENMGLAIERQRSNYHRLPKFLALGDAVWLFTPILSDRKLPKFKSGWSGPWRISKQINDLTFEIVYDARGARRVEIVSSDRLRRFFPDESSTPRPPPEGNLSLGGDELCHYFPSIRRPHMDSAPIDKQILPLRGCSSSSSQDTLSGFSQPSEFPTPSLPQDTSCLDSTSAVASSRRSSSSTSLSLPRADVHKSKQNSTPHLQNSPVTSSPVSLALDDSSPPPSTPTSLDTNDPKFRETFLQPEALPYKQQNVYDWDLTTANTDSSSSSSVERTGPPVSLAQPGRDETSRTHAREPNTRTVSKTHSDRLPSSFVDSEAYLRYAPDRDVQQRRCDRYFRRTNAYRDKTSAELGSGSSRVTLAPRPSDLPVDAAPEPGELGAPAEPAGDCPVSTTQE